MSLFGIDIAGEIAKGFAAAGGLEAGTLVKTTIGSRDASNLTAGPSTSTSSFSLQGFIDKGQVRLPTSRVVVTGNFMTILGGSVDSDAVPEVNDKVIMEGSTWELTELMERDPAAATYMFRVQVAADAS